MYVSLESCICSCFMVMNKAGMGRRERRRFVEEIDKTGSRKKMRSRRRLSIMNFNKDETTFIERERTSWEICMPNLELTHSGSNSVSTNELSFYIHHHWSVIVVVVHHIKSHPFLIVITCYWHPYIHRQPTHTGIYACMSPTNIFNHVSCCGITCLFINHSSRFSRCDKVTTNTLSSPLLLQHRWIQAFRILSATRFAQFTVSFESSFFISRTFKTFGFRIFIKFTFLWLEIQKRQ